MYICKDEKPTEFIWRSCHAEPVTNIPKCTANNKTCLFFHYYYFLLLFCRLQFSIAHLKCSCNSLSKTCPNIANDKTPDNAYSMEKHFVCVLFYVSVGILFVFSWWNFYYDFCCKSFVNVLMRKISSFIEFERKKKRKFKKSNKFWMKKKIGRKQQNCSSSSDGILNKTSTNSNWNEIKMVFVFVN